MLLQLPPPFSISFYRKTLKTGCLHLLAILLFPFSLVPTSVRLSSPALHWNCSSHFPCWHSDAISMLLLESFALCFGNTPLGSPPTSVCAALSLHCRIFNHHVLKWLPRSACRLSSCITSLTSRMTHLLRFKMPFVNQLMLTAPKFVSVAWTSPLNSIHMSNNSLGFYTWSKRYLKINMSRTILLSPLKLLPTLFISVTGNFCSFNCSGQKL